MLDLFGFFDRDLKLQVPQKNQQDPTEAVPSVSSRLEVKLFLNGTPYLDDGTIGTGAFGIVAKAIDQVLFSKFNFCHHFHHQLYC